MEIKPVAYIYTDFDEKFGIPRQSGRVPSLQGRVVFENEYKNPDAIRGIEEFSHLWLIFGFSKNERDKKALTVRPPRLGGNERKGVFASRAPYRPNPLGLSCVKLEKIEENKSEGLVLVVSGVDILSGTPIYDIKPYIPYSDAKPDAKGSFAQEHSEHSLEVDFPDEFLKIIPCDKREALVACLGDDPRPSYHNDERKYSMNFAGYDVHFKVVGQIIEVVGVDKSKNTASSG